jgi:hypothetical protein
MKPPNIMPEKMASKPLPDIQNQAPIIPPVVMLASKQKIHVASVFTRDVLQDLTLHSCKSLIGIPDRYRPPSFPDRRIHAQSHQARFVDPFPLE